MDNNFILAAYSEYLRDAPEWPNIRNATFEVTTLSRDASEDVTLFIRECFRLDCERDNKTGYYDFRLRNMTSSPKLKRIRIFGKILRLNVRASGTFFKVYDGTGIIKVYYSHRMAERNNAEAAGLVQINEREKAQAGRCDAMPDKDDKTKGNEISPTDLLKARGYLTAMGFLTLGVNKRRTAAQEESIWKRSMKPPMMLSACEVKGLTEKQYIDNCTALAELVKKRRTRD